MTATDNTPARCPCTFYERNPEAHDILLGIEDMPVPRAIELVATLISDTDMIDDVDDLGRFVGMHNWRDPAGMYDAGSFVDVASNQAANTPSSERSVQGAARACPPGDGRGGAGVSGRTETEARKDPKDVDVEAALAELRRGIELVQQGVDLLLSS